MSHQARHAARAPQSQQNRRTTARVLGLAAVAGLGVAAAPAAQAVTAPPANPASPASPGYDAMSVPMMDANAAPATAHAGTAKFGDMRLYPLAGTPLDLLSNNLRVPVGGMDVSTFPVTAPFRDGLPLHAIPVVGTLLPM